MIRETLHLECLLVVFAEIKTDTGNTVTLLDRASFQLQSIIILPLVTMTGYAFRPVINKSLIGVDPKVMPASYLFPQKL